MKSPLIAGLALLLVGAVAAPSSAQSRPRGRELGIPFPGTTGPLNAITDVAGIAVGHVTLIEGEGKLVPGKGPIRTGVTAILTRPKGNWDPVFAATYNQNGNGDMTGTNWIKESGFLEGPILLTGTHSVGTVRDAVIQWEGFPTAEGEDAVRASYTAIFGMIQLSIRFTVDEISVHGDWAIARTRSVGTVKVLATGTAAPEENRELFVLRRTAEGWKIARYLFNKSSQS